MATGADAAPARSPARRWAGIATAVVVAGFLGWALVDGWSSVSEYDWDVDVPLLAAASGVLLVFYLASGLGYAGIVERLHHPGPPRAALLSIWGRSLLGRYVPGSVVMVLGRVVLSHERGVPRRATVAATAYEQILALAVAGAAGVAFVGVYEGEAGPRLWLLGLVPLAALALHPRVFGPLSARALRLAGREPLPRLIPTRPLAGLVLWYAGTAILLGVGMWMAVRAAAGPVAGGPAFVGGAFLLSFALATLLVVVPSGLGVREGAFAVALAQNLPTGVAVALSVGSRLLLTVVELVFVALAVAAGRRA